MTAPTHPPFSKPASTGDHRGEQVSAMFDRIAGTYDLLNDCISFGMHRGWKKTAVNALHLRQGDHALDVCTGTGDLIRYIHPKVGVTGAVEGLDFSPEMLDVGRQRFSKHANVSFTLGSALELPYDDNQFDGAVISFGLRNVDNIERAIAEMTRVVKPDGWVVNVDTSPTPWLPGFWWYFSKLMPRVGWMFSSDKSAYTYLFESTRDFKTPEQLKTIFEQSGLKNVSLKGMAFGSVSCQAGQVNQSSSFGSTSHHGS